MNKFFWSLLKFLRKMQTIVCVLCVCLKDQDIYKLWDPVVGAGIQGICDSDKGMTEQGPALSEQMNMWSQFE